MDLTQAILYGQLINAAYAILPGATTNAAGLYSVPDLSPGNF